MVIFKQFKLMHMLLCLVAKIYSKIYTILTVSDEFRPYLIHASYIGIVHQPWRISYAKIVIEE